MSKLLQLVGLTLLGALLFSSAALAQDSSLDRNTPCANYRETPDGTQCSNLPDATSGSASPSASVSASAPTGREGDPCGSFESGSPEYEECFDEVVGGVTPSESSTASPTASSTASATASASAPASSPSLPETGGPAPFMVLVPLALLVGTGLLAFGVVGRN